MDNTFTGSDNTVYHIAPITLGDMKQFASYWQYREYYFLQELREQFPEQVTDEQISAAFATGTAKRPTEKEVSDGMGTKDGMVYLIWLCLRRNHPNITVKGVEAVVTLEALERVIAAIQASMGGKKKVEDTVTNPSLSAAPTNMPPVTSDGHPTM